MTLRNYKVDFEPAFQLTPKNITVWVKNLPIANLSDSSKSIYRMLVDLNKTLLDADKRLAILMVIEPVANNLAVALDKQFIRNHIALTEKQTKIAALVQAIQTELSIGYHTVIESILVPEVKRQQRKNLAFALVMATKCHGLIILRCYQLYTSIPGRIWRELYCLYQIARKYNLEQEPVSIRGTKNATNSHRCFLRILLLSISNPYQLRQQDIHLMWQLLPELSEYATLTSHAYNKNHFVLSLLSSSPPVYKSLYKPAKDGNEIKLTAFTVVEHLKHMLVSANESDRKNARKTMLLRHLVQCWGQGVQRSFARTPCNEHLNISIGLGATHYLLSQTQKEKKIDDMDDNNTTLEAMEGCLKNATLHNVAREEPQEKNENFNYLSSSETPSADVWAKLYRPEQAKKDDLSDSETGNRSPESIVRDSYRLQKVELLNMSPAGYCIQIETLNLPKHAQTGEILGFLETEPNNMETWSIGVVRWVRRQSKGALIQMGVQLLAPGAIPINIQLRNNKGDTNEFQRALLLPALTAVGQPQTVITNPLSFGTNNKVRILDHGREYDAKLSEEIASSSSFRQFQYERSGGGKQGKNRPDPVRDPSFDTQELEGIWDLI